MTGHLENLASKAHQRLIKGTMVFCKCVRPMRQAAVSVVHLDTVIVNVGVIIKGLVNVAVGWWQAMLIVQF